MQIGVDARLMHHQRAGISKYTWHLLQGLAQLNLDNEFIVFQHRKHTEPVITAPHFRRATLYAPVHTRLEQYLLPAELARFPLDLLHSTDFIPPLYARVPTVITVHDLAFLHYPHFLTAKSATYYGQIDRAVRHADAIIVPSENTKNDLVAMLGTDVAKISVIYEAAAEMFTLLPAGAAQTTLAKHGITQPYVLFVGTIEPRKNIGGLLHAFHHLRTRYGAANSRVAETLLVVAGGTGWLYDEVQETVQKLDLGNSVRFMGRVSDDLLHILYAGARAHVHPAYYEGFGLPPLEAMACGTPTIVSNVSSLPEVVNDAALLVDPNSSEEIAVALHRLIVDDTLHAELSEKGLARARCFSWQKAAKATLDVYRKVADSRAHVAHGLVSTPEKP